MFNLLLGLCGGFPTKLGRFVFTESALELIELVEFASVIGGFSFCFSEILIISASASFDSVSILFPLGVLLIMLVELRRRSWLDSRFPMD
jgi:hypothetical protein